MICMRGQIAQWPEQTAAHTLSLARASRWAAARCGLWSHSRSGLRSAAPPSALATSRGVQSVFVTDLVN